MPTMRQTVRASPREPVVPHDSICAMAAATDCPGSLTVLAALAALSVRPRAATEARAMVAAREDGGADTAGVADVAVTDTPVEYDADTPTEAVGIGPPKPGPRCGDGGGGRPTAAPSSVNDGTSGATDCVGACVPTTLVPAPPKPKPTAFWPPPPPL